MARVLAALRSDVTYPGDPGADVHKRLRPACSVSTTDTKDSVWIPMVSQQGLLVITRDTKIKQHRAELAAVEDHGARMVVLASPDATTAWAQLEVVMTQWRRIEELVQLPGPFIYAATGTTLRKLL